MNRALTDHWTLGPVRIPNRVVLAPLAGIGNWFVRLQSSRYGAGLVVSEMVSSFAVHYRNERTCRELLRIHPDEHPVSVQLFGHDPDGMASAAGGAEGRGGALPITVKLRTGLRPGDDSGVEVARALAYDGGVAGLSIHPRHASQRHKGKPDYALACSLVQELPV